MRTAFAPLSIVVLTFMLPCQTGTKIETSGTSDIPDILDLYIGTYTQNTENEGIYHYTFNTTNGETVLVQTIQTANPSFLAKRMGVPAI